MCCTILSLLNFCFQKHILQNSCERVEELVDIQIELITFSTQKILYVPNRSSKFQEKSSGEKRGVQSWGAVKGSVGSLPARTPGTSLPAGV